MFGLAQMRRQYFHQWEPRLLPSFFLQWDQSLQNWTRVLIRCPGSWAPFKGPCFRGKWQKRCHQMQWRSDKGTQKLINTKFSWSIYGECQQFCHIHKIYDKDRSQIVDCMILIGFQDAALPGSSLGGSRGCSRAQFMSTDHWKTNDRAGLKKNELSIPEESSMHWRPLLWIFWFFVLTRLIVWCS